MRASFAGVSVLGCSVAHLVGQAATGTRAVSGCVRGTILGPIVCGVAVDYPPDPS